MCGLRINADIFFWGGGRHLSQRVKIMWDEYGVSNTGCPRALSTCM